MARLGVARHRPVGPARLGWVRCGKAGPGGVWLGMAGWAGVARRGGVRYGKARSGAAWPADWAGSGTVRQGGVWHGATTGATPNNGRTHDDV